MEQQKGVRRRDVVLMVIGVVLLLVAVFPFFSGTVNFLNEKHSISSSSWCDVVSYTFYSEGSIHIEFTVYGGTIDFWAMNKAEYNNHYDWGEEFNYYVPPSLQNVSTATIDWVPPLNEEICFVWEYGYSHYSRSISMSISGNYAMFIPNWARFVAGALGGVLFFAGLSRVLSTRKRGSPTVPPPSMPSGEVKKIFCRYYGVENKADADFCEKCGMKTG